MPAAALQHLPSLIRCGIVLPLPAMHCLWLFLFLDTKELTFSFKMASSVAGSSWTWREKTERKRERRHKKEQFLTYIQIGFGCQWKYSVCWFVFFRCEHWDYFNFRTSSVGVSLKIWLSWESIFFPLSNPMNQTKMMCVHCFYSWSVMKHIPLCCSPPLLGKSHQWTTGPALLWRAMHMCKLYNWCYVKSDVCDQEKYCQSHTHINLVQ